MLAVRRSCLGSALVLLAVVGCDRTQPLEPLDASAAGFAVAAPSNTSVTAVSAIQIDVKWQDNSSNEAGFEVYVAATGLNDFNLWTTTGPNATAQSFSGNPRQEYCVKVRAFTALGQSGKVRAYSDFSNTACATTPPVAGPSNVAAQPLSSTTVAITWGPWTDVSIIILGFRVERSIDHGATWATLTQTDQFTTRTVDFGHTAESPELCYRVIVRTWLYGESTPSNVDCTTPPAGPTALVAAAVAGPAIQLSWSDNSAVEDGYEVLRAPDGVTFSPVADLPAGSASYVDADVTANRPYSYEVQAKKDGGVSDLSNTASAFVATEPPATPSDLNAWPGGSTWISLTWTDQSVNEDGFRVERSVNGGASWDVAGTTGMSEYWFTDPGRASEQGVCYRVIAFNGRGDSPPSNSDCATPPAAPTGLAAVTVEGLAIDLTWTDNSGVEDGYEVQRVVTYCDYDYCYSDYTTIATLGPGATSYRDAGLSPGEFYGYVVYAIKDGGRSDPSNEAAAWSDYAPPAPSDLAATAVSPGQIDLAWTNNASNAELFDIERCLGDALTCGDAGFVQIAWANGTATTFSDAGVQTGTTYTYRVRTYVGGRYSDPSNTATATTP